MSCCSAALGLCCLIITAPLQAATAPPGFFDYLYVEASTGSSAGGHAAVRFGDEVYHFQYSAPGIITAAVENWHSFDFDYRGVENRPIHVQRIEVSPGNDQRLRDAFQQRYVVQDTQLALLDATRRDVDLLRCVDGREPDETDNCGVNLAGAGYFYASKPSGDNEVEVALGSASPAISDLRREIERVYGKDALGARRRALRSRIERLAPSMRERVFLQDGVVATSERTFANAYSHLLLEWLALGVIAGEASPVPGAFRKCPGRLSAAERQALAAREEYQRHVSIELLASPRPDRGYPLLVSLARQVALRASRENGELFVLDTYADDVAAVSLEGLAEQGNVFELALEERRAEMEVARVAALAAPASDEIRWSRFEVAANVTLELEHGVSGGRLRRHQPELSPLRGTALQLGWPIPRLDPARRDAAIEDASSRRKEIETQLRALYRYDLLTRNCVTEIFRVLEEGNHGGTDLGGRVDMGASVNFIPFVSADAVRRAYRVSAEAVLPSYRQQGVARLLASDGPAWEVLLREETSLTSTLVPFDPGEEVFLFFTTDSVALRPLLGAANLVFGFGALVGGVLTAPVDGGELLGGAARGVLYSAPELVFFNIRKGTVPVLPPDWDAAESRAPVPVGGQGARTL